MDGKEIYIFNRHGQRLTGFDIPKDEVMNLYRGKGWMVLNGEYTNKGKSNDGHTFQNKFCLFDILVKDSKYLVGTTFEQRINTICEIYGESDNTLNQISDNIFMVKTYRSNFVETYEKLIKNDLMEGLVLKRKSAKLEIGSSENNNSKSQVKVRKPTKNYKF
jgi:ATP-dependent DNA ligase